MKQCPTDCDREVYEKGTVVFYSPPLPSDETEKWIGAVRRKSGQKVDWYYAAGRVVVKAMGDLDEVHKAILDSREIFRSLFLDDSSRSSMDANLARFAEAVPARNDLDVDLEMWPY